MRSAVETTRDSVRFGDTTIQFEVRRSRRRKKTLQLKLTDDGEVRVLVPWDTSKEWVRKCVLEHAQWIVEAKAKAAQRPRLRFVTGETVPFMGRKLTLHVTPADSDMATARRVGPEYVPDDEWPQGWMVGRRMDIPRDIGRLEITSPQHLEESVRAAEVRRAVCAWYYDQAGEWLPYAIKSWLPYFNRKRMPPVSIGNQRSQWGNCSPDGALRFTWRVMMLDRDLIDYIVIHELAHLRIKHHRKTFWGAVTRVHGETRYTRERLREAGRMLPL